MLNAVLANIAAIWIICFIISAVASCCMVYENRKTRRSPSHYLAAIVMSVIGPIALGLFMADIHPGLTDEG